MSPKSGKACKLESPKEPTEAEVASDDKTGAKTEIEATPVKRNPGDLSSVRVAARPSDNENEVNDNRTSWISIELKDAKGKPIPNEPYELKLPDGTISSGSLGPDGKSRIEGIEPGQCEVRFPQLHNAEWRKA